MALSVKFYKRLFLGLLAAAVVIPVGAAVALGISANANARENERLRAELEFCRRKLERLETPEQDISGGEEGPSFDYQRLYPELYCRGERPAGWVCSADTVYLTFDGTPGEETGAILDTLRSSGVKATFFLTGEGDAKAQELMCRMAEEGHTLGVYPRGSAEIYGSVEDFLGAFKASCDAVYEITGVYPEIFRFPGGSVNEYNAPICRALIAELARRGFSYYDWSVSLSQEPAESAAERVLAAVEGERRGIVRLEEGAAAGMLGPLIQTLRERGYELDALTGEVLPVSFAWEEAR